MNSFYWRGDRSLVKKDSSGEIRANKSDLYTRMKFSPLSAIYPVILTEMVKYFSTMSFRLETLNRGVPEENFGFFSNDTSRVRLGELPPISLYNFCQYSTAVLLQALQEAPEQAKLEIAEKVRDLCLSTSQDKVRDTSDVANLPRSHYLTTKSSGQPSAAGSSVELRETIISESLNTTLREAFYSADVQFKARVGEELAIALSDAQAPIEEYSETPFLLSEGVVFIGSSYEVDLFEFTAFSTYILGGGFLGWGELGIPDFVHQYIQRLDKAITGNN